MLVLFHEVPINTEDIRKKARSAVTVSFEFLNVIILVTKIYGFPE